MNLTKTGAIPELRKFINEKNRLCLRYEEVTNLMMTCESDELDGHFEERGNLITLIDMASTSIQEVLHSIGQPVQAVTDREKLPDELKWIYDESAAGYAALNRVSGVEPIIAGRLMALKEELEKALKSISNTPKIANYLQSNTGSRVSGSLFSEET